jgi:hypothetical protein
MPRKAPRKPGNYEVGYGKPPEHSRFRPGESGNRRGRPKGGTQLAHLRRTGACRAGGRQGRGGRTRKISKLEVAMTQLANKAATGDLRAIRMLFEVNRRRKDPATPTPAAPAAEASRPHPKPPIPDLEK